MQFKKPSKHLKTKIKNELARLRSKNLERVLSEGVLIVRPFTSLEDFQTKIQELNSFFIGEYKFTDKDKDEYTKLHQSSFKELITNIFVWKLTNYKISPKTITAELKSITGLHSSDLSSSQIKDRAKTAQKIIDRSPWLFFNKAADKKRKPKKA